MWPTSSNNSNQWSFNPAVYQNVPYEQVDWATLAQQWIKMKETLPSVNPGPPPPPAPQISKSNESQPPKSTPAASESRPANDIEGGEAPMDMDMNDDDVPPAVGVASDSNWKQWTDWQSQWGWGWPRNAGTVTLGEKTPSSASTVDSKVKSLSNDSNPVLNTYVSNIGTFPNNNGTNSTPQVPGSFNYNKVAGGTIPPHPKTGYWSNNSYPPTRKATGHKSNKNSNQKPIAEPYSPVIDAAKKKQLPAWIRDGLNKMEREKQKKIEYERMVQEKLMRDQMSPEKSFENVIFAENTETPADSPCPAEEAEPSPERYEKSRSSSAEVAPSRYQKSSDIVEDSNIIRKTKDQIMEESMLKVRRILTEFLLEATEIQVTAIAKEELRKRKSASAPQIRKSNALTSLTGNLGLAVYDSDSESSIEEREYDNRQIDSDEELEMLIERKKRNFTLVEDKIEEEIQNQEYKERQMLQRDQEFENDEDTCNSKLRDKENDDGGALEDSNNRSHRESSGPKERETKKTDKSNSVSSDKLNRRKQKKKRARSSSSSSSSSSESSSTSSSESTSSNSDRSHSKVESSSSSSHYSNNKKEDKKKAQKKGDIVVKGRERPKHHSKSRSTSRTRYSRDEKRYKDSKKRREKSRERRSSRDYRRVSESYHGRSSYRRDSRDSRDSSTSKYKNSKNRESSDSKHKRGRSRSTESRQSRYKRK